MFGANLAGELVDDAPGIALAVDALLGNEEGI